MYTDKPEEWLHAGEVLSDNTQANYCAQCKNCVYWNGGDNFSNKYNKSSCKQYPYPNFKPIEVINNEARCVYYTEKR